MPYKDKKKRNEYHRKWKARKRAKAIELGLCSNCGIRDVEPAYAECRKCRDTKYKERVRNKERDLAKKNKLREKYRAEGKCPGCSRPVLDDTTESCLHCRCRERGSGWN